MPCWGATGPWKHSLAFMPQDWWNWQIKWMKYVSVGSFQYKNQVNGEFFAYLWVILLYSSLESRLIPAVLEFGPVKLFGKLIRSIILQLSHSCQNRSLRVFSKQFNIKIVKYEDGMLILGQNYVFCGHNVVNFFSVISPTTETFQILGC